MIKKYRFILFYLLLAVGGFFVYSGAEDPVPMNRPFSEFPREKNGWRVTGESRFSQDVLDILRPTDYLSRKYAESGGKEIFLYVGYHNGGKDTGGIHSPKHCLPGSGWYEISDGEIELDVGGRPLSMAKAVYQKGDQKELFLYWFQMRGKSLSNEYALKGMEILGSLVHHRKDAAFVRVSVPFESDEDHALEVGKNFIREFQPVLQAFLPR